MKDWVINLTVVLADGSVIKTRHRPRYASHVSTFSNKTAKLPLGIT